MGYPTIADSLAMAKLYVEAGCDDIEVDIPSYDPYLETGAVQKRMAHALAQCPDFGPYLDAIAEMHRLYPDIGIQFMLYEDATNAIGINNVVAFCRQNGINRLICLGNRHPEYQTHFMEEGMEVVRFVGCDMNPDDIETAKAANGIVYLQYKPQAPQTATSGASLATRVQMLRDAGIHRPIYAGMGMYQPQDIRVALDAGCDGVYVGGVLIDLEGQPDKISDKIRQMKAEACKG